MMKIQGISHITFIVRDLERSAHLFTYLFGAREVYSSGDRYHSLTREKFLMIGELWIALMEGDPVAEKTYNHIAFRVSSDDLPRYHDMVEELKLEIMQSRPRVPGEGESLYFYDYDNHLFELHAGDCNERVEAYVQPG
jgi:catechol 2,3-dioxygenase-like lactoylglutathione lyase family enzyme